MSSFLSGNDDHDLNIDRDDDDDYQDHYDDHDDQECILLACCPRSFRVNLINASYECTQSDHTIALIMMMMVMMMGVTMMGVTMMVMMIVIALSTKPTTQSP